MCQPYLIKDILSLKYIQCQVTKFILNNYYVSAIKPDS